MPDRDRPLNERGRRAAATMRLKMRELGLAPDVVLVSTAKRTLETLAALEPWDDAPLIEPMDTLYLASLPQLLSALHGVPETVRSVLLIGHNPGMHELAITLAGPARAAEKRLADGFPTGALADFAVAGAWWQIGEGSGRLQHFVTPRSLDPSD